MDAKAGFMSALNAALLAFVWTSAKLPQETGCPQALSLLASSFSIVSLTFALWTVIPRASLKAVFGGKVSYALGYRPISFYSYVATAFPGGVDEFIRAAKGLSSEDLLRESLEQHYAISHVVHQKSLWVTRSGYLLLAAVLATGASLAILYL
jgi:hypothetical protein